MVLVTADSSVSSSRCGCSVSGTAGDAESDFSDLAEKEDEEEEAGGKGTSPERSSVMR